MEIFSVVLGRSVLLLGIILLLASWIVKKDNIDNMTAAKNFTYEAVPGFFRHDEELTGPQFRAVS